jgi:hypothetical protein
MTIVEHDRVALMTAIPSEGLKPGDVGAVMHAYADGPAYEVEFTSLDGHTAAVVTLEADQAHALSNRQEAGTHTMSAG